MRQVLMVVTMFAEQETSSFLAWKTGTSAVSPFCISVNDAHTNSFPDCGNTLQNGGAPASGGCTVQCLGQPEKICGGVNRLSLYKWFE